MRVVEGLPRDRGGHPPGGKTASLLSPAVTVGGRITMGVAMALLLFVAI